MAQPTAATVASTPAKSRRRPAAPKKPPTPKAPKVANGADALGSADTPLAYRHIEVRIISLDQRLDEFKDATVQRFADAERKTDGAHRRLQGCGHQPPVRHAPALLMPPTIA